MFDFSNYSDYIPSGRKIRGFVDYDVDDILKAVGLERRNVGMDVLGYSAVFVGGLLLGAVVAAFFAPDDLTDRAKGIAREYGSNFAGADAQGGGNNA